VSEKNEESEMVMRQAACNCGQLQVTCQGEPVRISTCHCLACQRRSGSIFGNQAWFPRENVTLTEGETRQFSRIADSGKSVSYNFCPVCGATVYWEAELFSGLMAVAVGAFGDPNFPAPTRSVWERSQHRWMDAFSGMGVKRSN
jgi:hypothetical protein